MKLVVPLAWATFLAGAVASPTRGGAERAYFYTVYLMEELGYTDTSLMTIAKDCVGTREGFRGQPNRCRLNEFLDHIWAPEQNKGPETRPRMDQIQWPNDVIKSATPSFEVKTMATWIQTAKLYPLNGDGSVNTAGRPTALKPGYTGLIDKDKLIAGAGDYYEAIKHTGRSYWNAAEAFESDIFWDSDEKEPYRIWEKRAEDGVKLVNNYRIQDSASFKWKLVRGKLRKLYPGVTDSSVVKMPIPYDNAGGAATVPDMEQIDIDNTANEWHNRGADTPAAIKSEINTLLAAHDATGDANAHQKALSGSKDALSLATTGRC